MREAKAKRRCQRVKDQAAQQLTRAIATVKKGGLKRADVALAVRNTRQGVIVVARTRRRAAVRHAISFVCMLDLAFNGVGSTRVLSKVAHLSPKWIRSLRHAVAHGAQVAESSTINDLGELLRSAREPGESMVAVNSIAFDESTQRLRLRMPVHVAGAWHVLVSLQHLVLSKYRRDGDSEQTCMIEFLRPPIPLLSTSAESICDGLFTQKSVLKYQALLDTAFEKSDMAAYHIDRDGCSAND